MAAIVKKTLQQRIEEAVQAKNWIVEHINGDAYVIDVGGGKEVQIMRAEEINAVMVSLFVRESGMALVAQTFRVNELTKANIDNAVIAALDVLEIVATKVEIH